MIIIPHSTIAELGNIGIGMVHPSEYNNNLYLAICKIELYNYVCWSIHLFNLMHCSMMARWIFFIFGTMVRFHRLLMHVK